MGSKIICERFMKPNFYQSIGQLLFSVKWLFNKVCSSVLLEQVAYDSKVKIHAIIILNTKQFLIKMHFILIFNLIVDDLIMRL